MIVLDTNVISELMEATPDPRVVAWFDSQDPTQLFTTAIVVAEIRYGISDLPEGRRRTDIDHRFDQFLDRGFRWAIWGFDASAAWRYGEIVAQRRRLGRPIGMADAMIAAIAIDRDAEAIATRNTADFEECGIALINPWIS